mgnify:CR=1 FL=1
MSTCLLGISYDNVQSRKDMNQDFFFSINRCPDHLGGVLQKRFEKDSVRSESDQSFHKEVCRNSTGEAMCLNTFKTVGMYVAGSEY